MLGIIASSLLICSSGVTSSELAMQLPTALLTTKHVTAVKLTRIISVISLVLVRDTVFSTGPTALSKLVSLHLYIGRPFSTSPAETSALAI